MPVAGGGGHRLLPLAVERGCLISDETVRDHQKSCLNRELPELTGRPEHDGVAVIIGGSPSLDWYLDDIRSLMADGAQTFAVNGAYKHLLSQGIVPGVCVLADGLPEVAGYVRGHHPGTRFLVASQCHPDVFDALEGADVTVWHCWNGADNEEHLKRLLTERYGQAWVIVAGGTTVALRCLNIGHLCGYRTFRMYGVDSSFLNGRTHAYDMPEQPTTFPLFCAGRTFHATGGMAEQANLFGRFYRTLFWDCDIRAYGPGLIPHICRIHNRSKEASA